MTTRRKNKRRRNTYSKIKGIRKYNTPKQLFGTRLHNTNKQCIGKQYVKFVHSIDIGGGSDKDANNTNKKMKDYNYQRIQNIHSQLTADYFRIAPNSHFAGYCGTPNQSKYSIDNSYSTTILPGRKTFYLYPSITNGHHFNTSYLEYSAATFVPKLPNQLPNQLAPPLPPPPPPKKHVLIETNVSGIDDLIALANTYPNDPEIEYNINIAAIHNIKEPLQKLNNMIGIRTVKTSIVDQIIYYVQNFHKLGCSTNDFMHTVIYGPPGTGKTEIAKCIGEIFSKLGVLRGGTFQKVTRADLIAGYLGQTATKTRDVIEKSVGGVLFIDEAYALGNREKGDSFSKECIDTLCEALSDKKDNLMVIIAGYEHELKTCFFDYNQGLESRFTWRFHTNEYTHDELYQIFVKKVLDAKWSIPDTELFSPSWFAEHRKYFTYFGRDIETLFAKTKIAHSKRVFCTPTAEKTVLTIQDIDGGFQLFLQNDEIKKRGNHFTGAEHMYV